MGFKAASGLLAAFVLLVAVAALAQDGEYRPPHPDPRKQARPVTPGSRQNDPGPPTPGEIPPGPGPRTGIHRDDARLTARIWWEANRHRFLPATPELPLREEVVRVLRDASQAESSAVRDRSIFGLGRAGAIAAFDRIRRDVGARSLDVSASAMLALGLLGDDSASPILRKVAGDGEVGINLRLHATLGLGLLESPDDAAFLREILNEEWEGHVRSAAIVAAGLHRDGKAVNSLGRLLLDAHPLRSPETAGPGVPRIGIAHRCLAAWALGEIMTPLCYDYLLLALERGEPPVMGAAAIALLRARGTAGLPALKRLLPAGSPLQVRQYALLGLAERKDPRTLLEAGRILDTPAERDGYLGPFAALALGVSGEKRLGAKLLEVLAEKEARDETRAAAALGLGILGDPKSAPGLEKVLLVEKSPEVVGAGLIADALLGGRHALALARRVLRESELPGPRRDAATAMGILAAPESADDLVAALELGFHVNREAARALARVDPKRAAAELTTRLTDPSVNVARCAAHTLGALIDRRRPPVLTRLIAGTNLLSDAIVAKACVYQMNEYLFELLWR